MMSAAGRTSHFARLTGLIVVCIGLWAAGAGAADVIPRTVALTGGAAPGTNKLFSKFIDPIIDSHGRVAFSGELRFDTEQNEGLWSEHQGALQLMVRKHSQEPVPSPQAFFNFSNWQVYGDGQVAFSPDPPKFTQGWPGSYNTVDRPMDYDRWAVNDGGELAYVSADGQSLIRTSQGGDETIATAGQTLPGLPAGLTANHFVRPAFNDSGNLAFQASVKDASGPVPGGGIWKTNGDVLTPVAIVGNVAPGAPDGRRFTDTRPPSINALGDVAFQASVEEGAENGLWRTVQGQLEMVAYRHQPAPGVAGNVDFDFFYTPAINDHGDVAFRAELKGDLPSVEYSGGIWAQHDGQLEHIMHEGMPVPDAAAGATFFDVEGGLQPQINNAGHLVFEAQIAAGMTTGRGLFAYNVIGDYLWSIQSGDQLEVADNDFRTVTDVYLARSAAEMSAGNTTNGHQSSLNDAGQLVFLAQFTDLTSGVFVVNLPPATVPEPGTILLLASGAVVLLTRRRQRGPR